MPALRIGPLRIADGRGTYEPGDIVEFPSADLQALADAKAVDPDSGKLLCKPISASAAAAVLAAAVEPDPPPAKAVSAATPDATKPDASKSAAAPVAPATPEKS